MAVKIAISAVIPGTDNACAYMGDGALSFYWVLGPGGTGDKDGSSRLC